MHSPYRPGKKVPSPLPDNFTPDMVSDTARETSLNWFYKVASIRELLPRLYVEIAILKSYRFLDKSDIKEALERLSKTIRGIGDPLVAAYARCYLCRVGMTVTDDKEFLKNSLNDFLFVYHTVRRGELTLVRVIAMLYPTDIRRWNPIGNHASTNGFEWISDAVHSVHRLVNAGHIQRIRRFTRWHSKSLPRKEEQVRANRRNSYWPVVFILKSAYRYSGLLLNSIMNSFKPNFIANRAEKFVSIISNSTTEGITKAQLFRSFGLCLSQCPPPVDQRVSVLNGSWKTISTFTHVAEYIPCVEPWAQYTAMNFELPEVKNFLGDVLSRLNQNRAFENHYPEMLSIVDKVVTHTKSFEGLLISVSWALYNYLPVFVVKRCLHFRRIIFFRSLIYSKKNPSNWTSARISWLRAKINRKIASTIRW